MQEPKLQRALVEMASRKRRLLPPVSPGRCRTSGPPGELQAAAEKLRHGATGAEPREAGATCAEPREAGATCAERPRRLLWDFFSRPCVALARELLGQVMVRRLVDGTEVRGRIVETEAYLGGEDQASHSRGGRRSLSNAAMFMNPGTLYVYQIYGVYFCLNVSSEGDGAAVLVRSLEPLQGLDAMRGLRSKRRRAGGKPLKDHQLCNGPSKLCQALDITKNFDKEHLATVTDLWMERGPEAIAASDIVSASRIGIGYAGEWW
ncbi:DNA-3-methyladenine glycosylase [Narcine bancroftii]|uniref:DNA-3-methyladenine glycosylase n=1 Tax=Narcine bancroftii TaxID=1343680 RepID=UPI00383179E5